MLIVDEIQCGLGRTGEWCAYQHYGILPDVTTLAKPLGGGIPIGAMLCNEEAARAFTPGMHGTTFGGGPLACAVAIAVIDAMRSDNLLQHIQEAGEYFLSRLHALAERHPCIVDVRGMGLMLGVELADAEIAKHSATQMMERRILINRTSESVLRFLPPYIIEQKHIDQTVQTLDEILTHSAAAAASPVAAQGALG